MVFFDHPSCVHFQKGFLSSFLHLEMLKNAVKMVKNMNSWQMFLKKKKKKFCGRHCKNRRQRKMLLVKIYDEHALWNSSIKLFRLVWLCSFSTCPVLVKVLETFLCLHHKMAGGISVLPCSITLSSLTFVHYLHNSFTHFN
jgi:hypothetical protein